MSSIFDVPSGLLFILSLVTTNPSDVATAATGLAAPKPSVALDLNKAPCRHSEQAWLAALKDGAGGVAFSGLADRIFLTSGGRYYVPVAQDRRELLRLQRDSTVSCFIALSSAAANATRLKSGLGKDASLSELYLAHVLGSAKAQKILRAKRRSPDARMAKLFPNLDRILPGLYAGAGKRMTLAGFSKRLDRAIRRQVDQAQGRKPRRARHILRKTRKSKVSARQTRSVVHKAKISARDLLQAGLSPKQRLQHTQQHSKGMQSNLHRFDFIGAIPAHEKTSQVQKKDDTLSF